MAVVVVLVCVLRLSSYHAKSFLQTEKFLFLSKYLKLVAVCVQSCWMSVYQ